MTSTEINNVIVSSQEDEFFGTSPQAIKTNLLIVCNFFLPQNNIAVRRIFSFATKLNLGQVLILTTKKNPRHDGRLETDSLTRSAGADYITVEIPYSQPTSDQTSSQIITDRLPAGAIKQRIIKHIKEIVSPDLLDRRLPFLFKSIRWIMSWKQKGASPKLVLSSSPLFINHFIGFFAARMFKAFWIMDYRDLWTLDPVRCGKGPFFLIERIIELFLVNRADLILAVSEGQKRALKQLAPKKNIEVIMNGVDAQVMAALKSQESLVRTGPIRMIYLGTVLPGKRDIVPLFEALKGLRNENKSPDLVIEFYGGTHEYVSELIERYHLWDSVKSFRLITSNEALAKYADADLLLFLDWMDPRVPGVLTGKLFEYIASGANILSLAGDLKSEANELIRHHEAGSVILNTAQDIKKYLLDLENHRQKFRQARKVRRSANEFQRDVIAQRLSEIIMNKSGLNRLGI